MQHPITNNQFSCVQSLNVSKKNNLYTLLYYTMSYLMENK